MKVLILFPGITDPLTPTSIPGLRCRLAVGHQTSFFSSSAHPCLRLAFIHVPPASHWSSRYRIRATRTVFPITARQLRSFPNRRCRKSKDIPCGERPPKTVADALASLDTGKNLVESAETTGATSYRNGDRLAVWAVRPAPEWAPAGQLFRRMQGRHRLKSDTHQEDESAVRRQLADRCVYVE